MKQNMYQVLIVEDDPMVAMINEKYVSKHKKFTVIGSCRDGEAALGFLEQHSVDLVIMDVFMPRMDGFETLRQIRKRKLGVEVVMVTAANEREALEEALHLGIVDYLIKPFTFDRFRMALDKYIAHRDALNDLNTLNQKSVDFIMDNTRRKSGDIHPKGIQDQTLGLILAYMKNTPGIWHTGDEIAEKVALTAVTVRRYLTYLTEAGVVTAEINYNTGGRPCMMYRIE